MLLTQKKRETTFETGKTLYEDYILETLKNAIRNNSILKGENVALKPKDIHAVYTLDNLIDHPDLFAKYPQIKDTEIVFADFHSRKKRGLTSG